MLLHDIGSESLLLSELETSVLTLAVALFVGRTFRAGLDSDLVSTELRILLLFEEEEEEPGLEMVLDFLVADKVLVDDDFSGKSSSSSDESKRLLLFDGFLANVCLDGFELGL